MANNARSLETAPTVSVDLWRSVLPRSGQDILTSSSLFALMQQLGPSVVFTPRIFVLDGELACPDRDCPESCTADYRFCMGANSGQQRIEESMRELCLWDIIASAGPIDPLFRLKRLSDYVRGIKAECDTGEDSLTEECSKSVHEEFKFVWSTTQDCVASSGELLLQKQLELINSQGVKAPLPALSLNGAFVEMLDLTAYHVAEQVCQDSELKASVNYPKTLCDCTAGTLSNSQADFALDCLVDKTDPPADGSSGRLNTDMQVLIAFMSLGIVGLLFLVYRCFRRAQHAERYIVAFEDEQAKADNYFDAQQEGVSISDETSSAASVRDVNSSQDGLEMAALHTSEFGGASAAVV